jgi:hypothetical protein
VNHSRHASTSLQAKLGNPSPIRFQVKQAARSRRVSCVIFILPSILLRNQQIIAHLVLRPKPRDRHGDFVGQITKLQLPVLRPKPGETVDLSFEAKPRNPCSSSPCAWCRQHTTSFDLLIIWPPSTRPVVDHPWSSAPSLLLLPRSSSMSAMPHLSPTHHETSKCVSPHETDSRVEPPKFPGFKFKPRQINYLSQINPRTTWLPNLPLMSILKTQRHKV